MSGNIKHLDCSGEKTVADMPIVGGDRTHELVEILEDGGGIRLVEPTSLPDYPMDGEQAQITKP